MDFDNAKENIQPLAQGRNASILQASLRVESQELLACRKVLEKEIHDYSGDDPLSVWYKYIEWIEQSFPSGGKESGLQEVLSKCLAHFESDERYKQDRRMIKLYIKFIDSHKDPAECYKQLFSEGIGTMVADFYIAWAYYYDLAGNTRMADEIFLRGIACRAQPLEELQEARQHFGFSVAQRFMYKDDDPIREETNRQLYERRMALTSLRGHRRKQIVGSIRTGSAIKSVSPGKVKIDMPSTSSQRENTRVQVFRDENENPNATMEPPSNSTSSNEVTKSGVRCIIDEARNQENQKEPGPWNKAYNRKKGKTLFSSTRTSELGFEIHEDTCEDTLNKTCIPPIPIAENEIKFDKPFIYPPNFCSKSNPIKGWITPVTTEEMPDVRTLPSYNKCKLYPRPNMELQPEELRAYNILKKRGIQNDFTKQRDIYWGNGPQYNIRLYPHFASQSKPQILDSIDEFFIPEKLPGLKVAFDDIYNKEDKIERQFEEILALSIKPNKTIIETADMDETMCKTSEQIQRRKSFYPMRKSLAYTTFKTLSRMSLMPELSGNHENPAMMGHSACSNNSGGADAVQDDREVKPSSLQKNKVQQEQSQALTVENIVPLTSHLVLNDDKPLKSNLHTEKADEIKPHSNVVSEPTVSDASSTKPLHIFVDDSSVEVIGNKTLPDGNDFQFKAPALPISNPTSVAVVPKKLQFEIFDDENFGIPDQISTLKTDHGCIAGDFFDPEESCSTQTFNIFLKAQSVSTPKVIGKTKPQRHFGNILKEVPQSTIQEEKQDDNDNLNCKSDNQDCAPETPPVPTTYSPPRQQLSTILETSEHGTTQSTHTTGGTTKSTLGSPEIDLDSQAQTTTTTAANQLQTVLEAVKEISCESSASVMNNEQIQNTETNASKTSHFSDKNIKTPVAVRLNTKRANEGLNFSIFEDSINKDQDKVGNFSRLEQKEDTATGGVFKTSPSICFQDDKTENISKMLITSQEIKFQDDKTETTKIMFQPLMQTKFQDDKTETISKMLLDPPQVIKFPEDNTETISKFLLAPPELAKFEDETMEQKIIEKEKTLQSHLIQDHSFEFFGQTPPKPARQLAAKQLDRCLLSHIRTAANSRTPLTFEAKRFCEKDTPEIKKPECKALFEDEFQSNFKSNYPTYMKDSALPDFSLVVENQPVFTQPKAKHKSKSCFRDSFVPDILAIEDSQQTNQVQPKKHHNQSTVAEFSLTKNTQIQPNKQEQKDSENLQNNESINKLSQPNESKCLNPFSNRSLITANSKINLEQNMNWKQTSNCSNVSHKTQEEGAIFTNILMDTFMKGFSEINQPPHVPNDTNQMSLLKPIKKNSSLRFLNESLKQNSLNSTNVPENYTNIANISTTRDTKLNFLLPKSSKECLPNKEKSSAGSNTDKHFEHNFETEMFGTNVSMIKNSTWLPNHGPVASENDKQLLQIQEKSLHIKSEDVSSHSLASSETSKKVASLDKEFHSSNFSIEISASELEAINAKSLNNVDNPIVILESPEHNNDDHEMSIYFKETPKTPKPQVHIWDDVDAHQANTENQYVYSEPDLNQTHQIIENMFVDPNVNPFNVDLINAFLEQHYVISYLKSLPTCQLVGRIQRLKQNATIDINGNSFVVMKLIGEGAYGAVFCGKEKSTDKLVAMKQERPPNYWEYYICLEIQERVRTDEMLPAYMSVDYALVGNNSSILISEFSQYGSLITVCNKIKKHTMKNVDEYVVMLLTSELLEIMDHLHAVNVIHADVKADNFLLMNKLTYPATKRHLQLIDFGVSIDMKLFKEGQTFSFVHSDNSFNCPEMRERRPWTYQIDLYGLAGVIHVLLFGKYMDIERQSRGFWMHKTNVPRYLNKSLWGEIFKTLLNIRDCNSMPNLQELRALLKTEIEEKDKYVLRTVNEFNRCLSL